MTSITSVKCGLRTRIRSQVLFDGILDDVREMSALAVETSLYIMFKLQRQWERGEFPTSKIKFLPYFYHVLHNNKEKYKIDPNYVKVRGSIGYYDGSARTNIFTQLSKVYETNFINNIIVHGYKRLRAYLYRKGHDSETVYRTLDKLFNPRSTHDANDACLNDLAEIGYNGGGFYDLKTNYFKYIEIFYRLQRSIEDHNINQHLNGQRNFKRVFTLIPLFHHGLKHIQYDTRALWELAKKLKIFEGTEAAFVRDGCWARFFKFDDLETATKK